jgi:hypothetical protein
VSCEDDPPDENCSDLDDTWTWAGTAWTSLDVTGPGARDGAGVAAVGGLLVLFGGEVSGSDCYLSDTWTWNGASWTMAGAGGPGPVAGAAAASLNGEGVFFGGYETTSPYPTCSTSEAANTWTWRSGAWTELHGSGPPASPGVMAAR